MTGHSGYRILLDDRRIVHSKDVVFEEGRGHRTMNAPEMNGHQISRGSKLDNRTDKLIRASWDLANTRNPAYNQTSSELLRT